ncbi:hypothetical protein Mgra_00005546 [Meloidogyne graminicola]|uniref:Uncharacterized protein n=1 Tax=Meloidogyne graminicola TaxID=189291 RepID=A0A8S9ZP95_9BILA|nr:hypothetical protein Mgra_00005546 [Meloidogyne graminicola]
MNNQNPTSGKGMTLDQLLAQNIGIEIEDTIKQSTSQGSNSVVFSFTGQNAGFPTIPNQFSCNSGHQGTSNLSSINVAGMIELANRTIVVFRNKTTSVSSQKYFSDWILKSFNLPDKSVSDISQAYVVDDFYAVFFVLANKKAYDNILAIYRSNSFNADQFIIVPANEILIEGTLAMRRLNQQQEVGSSNSDGNLPTLNTCFLSLLGDHRSQSSSPKLNQNVPSEQLDSNRIIWENIAAAVDQLLFRLMIPAYRRLLATNSLPYNFSGDFSALNNSDNSSTKSAPPAPKKR